MTDVLWQAHCAALRSYFAQPSVLGISICVTSFRNWYRRFADDAVPEELLNRVRVNLARHLH